MRHGITRTAPLAGWLCLYGVLLAQTTAVPAAPDAAKDERPVALCTALTRPSPCERIF